MPACRISIGKQVTTFTDNLKGDLPIIVYSSTSKWAEANAAAMTRQSLQDEVLRIVGERRATVLFVTHDLDEALYLGDRVIALYSNPGRIARMVDIPLPRPRNQLASRESPEFLRLRRELFTVMQEIGA